jgi:hypothetical protein
LELLQRDRARLEKVSSESAASRDHGTPRGNNSDYAKLGARPKAKK